MTVHAVITGDLIGSTRAAGGPDLAMAALQRAAQDWAQALHFTRFRGDGWQVLCPAPGLALRIALALAAALASSGSRISTRLAVGWGAAHLGTGEGNSGAGLGGASGSAFIRSGRALDAMVRGRTWAVEGGAGLPDWVRALFTLAEFQSGRWTKGQAEAVAATLGPVQRSPEDWAARAGLTRQAWKARLDGSGIGFWAPALTAVEAWDGAGIGDG